MTRRSIALAAAIVFVLMLAVSPAAVAGKAPRGGGGSTGAVITFNPASTTLGSQYTVNGSGFRPNTWISVGAHFTDTTWWNSKVTDSQGKFSLTFTATSPAVSSTRPWRWATTAASGGEPARR